MAPITLGNKIPDVALMYLDNDNESHKFNLHKELKGKKVMLIAVPGAFTPTCSQKHIPNFTTLAKEIKSKGVSEIIVVSCLFMIQLRLLLIRQTGSYCLRFFLSYDALDTLALVLPDF